MEPCVASFVLFHLVQNEMDPITIIGTAGAVANIVEVLGKTINSLHEFQKQWRDADFTLAVLISQLGALRAAITKIQQWVDIEFSDPHHQLTMDLDLTLTCCRTLVAMIDAQITGLQSSSDGSLSAGSRVKLVFGSGKIEDLQKIIDRQTSALTLLLTACNR